MKGKALLQCIKFILGLRVASTQTTNKEIEAIRKYAADKKYAVEIGIFEAVNTVSIA